MGESLDFLLPLFRKARLRLPGKAGSSKVLCSMEDRLRWHLARWSGRIDDVKRALQDCQDPEEYFRAAGQLIPPHQIQSEICNFLRFVQTEQPLTVCEIGTAEGGTTFLLSHALPSVQMLIGVDLFVWNRRLLRALSRSSVELHFVSGSSHEQSSRGEVAKLLDGRLIDLLFIDGDHSFEGVARDFDMYQPLVRKNGLIAFHDIIPDHYTRFGRHTGRWAGDVPLFWRKICGNYEHWEFVEDSDQDGLGIGVIRNRTSNDT